MIGGNWTLMIPQQFLADHGVDYSIKSSFLVLPDGTVLGDEGGWFSATRAAQVGRSLP